MSALIYPGCLNAISAEPGMAKTWLALIATAQLIDKGERVMYLDYEGNPRAVGARLRALGVEPKKADLITYIRPGVVGPAEKSALVGMVQAEGHALVVIDGEAKSLWRQSLSENEADDIGKWMETLVWPFTKEGAAVLTLDHVVKDKEKQQRYARGSGAKLGEVDGVAFTLEGAKFSREQAGWVRMIVTKDREGFVGAEGETAAIVHFTPENGRLGVRIMRPSQETGGEGDKPWEPDVLMDRVMVYMASQPAGERLSKNAIADNVHGSRKWLLQAVDALVDARKLVAEQHRGYTVFGLPRLLEIVPDPPQDEIF